MKTIILLPFLLISSFVVSQIDTSAHEEIEMAQSQISELYQFKRETEVKLAHVQLNLEKSHKVFKSGIALWVASMLVGAASIGAGYASAPTELTFGTGFLASGLSIASIVTIINSHKWIGRAGAKPPRNPEWEH